MAFLTYKLYNDLQQPKLLKELVIKKLVDNCARPTNK